MAKFEGLCESISADLGRGRKIRYRLKETQAQKEMSREPSILIGPFAIFPLIHLQHHQPKSEAFYQMLRQPSAFESLGIDRCVALQSSVRTNVSGGTAEARFLRNVSYGHEAGVWISHRAARGTRGPIGAAHDE